MTDGVDDRSAGDEPSRDRRSAAHGPGAHLALVGAFVLLALIGVATIALDDDQRVAIVGDSITVVSGPALDETLAGDHDLSVEANLGVTLEQMAVPARRLAAEEPDVAVIELGSNDVLLDVPLDRSRRAIEEMIATFRDAGVGCIHVVDVSTHMVRNDGRATGDAARALNEVTRDLADGAEDLTIIAWDAVVSEAEARGEPLTTDTVHPSAEGSEVLARLLAESLEAGCG